MLFQSSLVNGDETNAINNNRYRCKEWQLPKDGIWYPAEDVTDVFESSTLRVELYREPNPSPQEHR